MSSSLGLTVRSIVIYHPDVPAVIHGEQSITYSRLMGRVAHLAGRIDGTSGPGSVVAVAAGRGIDGVVAMLATWWAGCTYMPLDTSVPPSRLQQILGTASPDLILNYIKGIQTSDIAAPMMSIGM